MKNTIYLIAIIGLQTACLPKANNNATEETTEAITAIDSNSINIQPTTNEAIPAYNFEAHTDFEAFWTDFKKAVLANDREAVAKMTNFPFKDEVGDDIINSVDIYGKQSENAKKMQSLTSKDKTAFLNKYDKIFLSATVSAVKNNKYEKYDPSWEEEPNGSPILKGEYLLTIDFEAVHDGRMHDMAFKKSNGIFKLAYMPYYP